MFLSNVQSLLPKIDEVNAFASTMKPDIFVFCETWLSDAIDDKDIDIAGYCPPIRNDRIDRRGGGVCIYFKQDIACNVITVGNCPPCIESIWAHFPFFNILIHALYVPPSLSASQLNLVTEYIVSGFDDVTNLVKDCHVVILGDLNHLPTSSLEQSLGLLQVVQEATRGNAVLDKILIEPPLDNYYNTPIVGPNFGKSDHLSIFLKPLLQQDYSPSIVKVYDYRKSYMDEFLSRLKYQRWQDIYKSSESVDSKCENFYRKVEDALLAFPFAYVEMSPNEKPWMTPKLKYLINCRFEAFRLKQFSKYRHLRAKVKQEISKAKMLWLQKLKQSPKGIWKAVRPSSNRIQNCGNLLKTFTPADIPDAISTVLSSAFSPPSASSFVLPMDETGSFDIPLTVEATESRLMKLKVGKSSGHDRLTARLLRVASAILAPPLTHIFVQSISEGAFPKMWKLANITPIPKKPNPAITDFRPISLLPLPSKVLESIVLSEVKKALLDRYGSNQFGFRPGSSTLLAHIAIHDFVTKQLDMPTTHGVALVAYDLKKAFDSVSHLCLLNTLSRLDLPSSFLKWIQSFLQDRSQVVFFNGYRSSTIVHVTSGVPQGSILAPYLFAVHMSSLSSSSPKAKMIKYADDVTVLIPFRRRDSIADAVHAETQHIKGWCLQNGLALNEEKTKVLLFSKLKIDNELLNGVPAIVSSAKILGVTFNSRLNWKDHVAEICKSASRRIYVLKELKKIDSITKKDLLQVYQGLILSVLEYNSALFTSMTAESKGKLDKLRKRCHRIICGQNCTCTDFPSLDDRRLDQTFKVFTNMQAHDHILHHLVPHKLPRTNHFFIEHRRSELRARSFIPFCCVRCNSLLRK